MKLFLSLAFLFSVGSFLGWCIELVVRRLNHGNWCNPGFLTGPVLPLYGTGLVLMYLICQFCERVDTGYAWLNAILPVLLIALAMTALEYLTGLALLKGMNLRLWDYTGSFGNVQGIICPLYSFLWALCGVGYRFFLHGLVLRCTDWLAEHMFYGFFLGIFYGVLLVDVASAFQLATKLRSWAAKSGIVVRYERFKDMLYERAEQRREKVNFFFVMHAPHQWQETLDAYLKTRQADGRHSRREKTEPKDESPDGNSAADRNGKSAGGSGDESGC